MSCGHAMPSCTMPSAPTLLCRGRAGPYEDAGARLRRVCRSPSCGRPRPLCSEQGLPLRLELRKLHLNNVVVVHLSLRFDMP